jgi:2'-5' RNA ligase
VWRAFYAIELPAELREPIARWQSMLRALDLTATYPPPENLHITLVFLGDIFAGQAHALAATLDAEAAACPPLHIRVHGLGFFGPPRAPRVVWAGVEAPPSLELLYVRLAKAARAMGIPIESRPYRPHVTLARIRSSRNADALTSFLASHKSAFVGEFIAPRACLFRSRLDAPRPLHTVLHAAPLKGV